MADKKNSGVPKQPLQEEGIVARLKNAAGGELAGLTTYTGLLGRSPREGYWLLYPTLDMSTSIEIEESDIVHSEPLPPEQSPFGGLGGTLVFVRKGAQVTTTRTLSRTSQAGAGDEFDLDIRMGKSTPRLPLPTNTDLPCYLTFYQMICQIGNPGGGGGGMTPDTGYPTCANTCDDTCDTCHTCHQATCQTCYGATCHTCQTKCGTCVTCNCTNIPDSCVACTKVCP